MKSARNGSSEYPDSSRQLPWHWMFGVAAVLAAGTGAWTLWGSSEVRIARPLPSVSSQRLFPLKEVLDASNLKSLQHQQVILAGTFTGHVVVLKDRDMAGRSGYYVLEPLIERGDNGLAVLVQRGWVAPNSRDFERRIISPKHEVVIEGRLAIPSLGLDDKAAGEKGLMRENLNLQRYSREIGIPLVPMVVLEEPGPDWTEKQIRQDLFQRRWSELYPEDKNIARNGWGLLVLGAAFAALGLWMQPTRRRR